jgi:4-hydroxybenzoate polyprenyltransferase
MTSQQDAKPADAIADNWVDRFLPLALQPYARLARLDRPIGSWLLFLPCLWGLMLSAPDARLAPPLTTVLLYGLGALVMRGAGCTYNDIVDRNIDRQVARTAGRPLAAGLVSVPQAVFFLLAQGLIGLLILLQFNTLTIELGIASLALVASYPFMKRITWWPQLWLGLTFNWGVLMGAATLLNEIPPAAVWLYLAGIFWTLGYDTIYAHQDREDDALVGVKSSARWLGERTRPAVAFFYASMLISLALAGLSHQMGILFWIGLVIVAGHLGRQIILLDIHNPDICLALFRRNRDTGIIVALALLLGWQG